EQPLRRREDQPRRLVKRPQGGLGAQQFLDLAAEENVAGTGLLEVRRPVLLGVLLDGLQEDRFGLVGPLVHVPRSHGSATALCPSADWAGRFSHGRRKKCKKTAEASRLGGPQKLVVEPGARVLPVSVSRRGRHAERLAGLVHGQAREV